MPRIRLFKKQIRKMRWKCLTPKSQLVLERIRLHTDVYFVGWEDRLTEVVGQPSKMRKQLHHEECHQRCIQRLWEIYFRYRNFEK